MHHFAFVATGHELSDTWTLSFPTNAFGCQECLIRTLKVLSQTVSPRKILTTIGLLLLGAVQGLSLHLLIITFGKKS